MLTVLFALAVLLVIAYAYGLRKLNVPVLAVISSFGLAYYTVLLTSGKLETFFAHDPYSKLFPNLWEHGIRGDFGIDPAYAFREYFINEQGTEVVYFGFMPAILRGLGSIFTGNLYGPNLGNLSIILAAALMLAAVIYSVKKLDLLHDRVKRHTLGFVIAILFASSFAYTAIWGRVHNEVIAWGAAWGVIFAAFYALWVFGLRQQRRPWHAAVMGSALGLGFMTRPTVALTMAVPFGFLVLAAVWKYAQEKSAAELKLLLPGIICAILLGAFTMNINYQRWGNPLTFVQMDRHVELLRENPQRGADLRQAGEFNLNRLPNSLQYYLLPSQDNLSKSPPFIEIDQRLTVMESAPQYDYIEGSRVPIVLSMTFLLVLAGCGAARIRSLKQPEKYASLALVAGGTLTIVALCTVYAVALRYSADFLPLIVFCALIYLVALRKKAKKMSQVRAAGWQVLLLVSVVVTTLTTLQYKIISGQIGLSEDFRTNLSRQINFPPEKDAKIFIINGEPHQAVPYRQ